jgi:hypothetical protein
MGIGDFASNLFAKLTRTKESTQETKIIETEDVKTEVNLGEGGISDERVGFKDKIFEVKNVKGTAFWDEVIRRLGKEYTYPTTSYIEALMNYDGGNRDSKTIHRIWDTSWQLSVKLQENDKTGEVTENSINMLRDALLMELKKYSGLEIPNDMIEKRWTKSQNKSESFWTYMQQQVDKFGFKCDVKEGIEYLKKYDAGSREDDVIKGIREISNNWEVKLIEDEDKGEFIKSSVDVLREKYLDFLEAEGFKFPSEKDLNKNYRTER